MRLSTFIINMIFFIFLHNITLNTNRQISVHINYCGFENRSIFSSKRSSLGMNIPKLDCGTVITNLFFILISNIRSKPLYFRVRKSKYECTNVILCGMSVVNTDFFDKRSAVLSVNFTFKKMKCRQSGRFVYNLFINLFFLLTCVNPSQYTSYFMLSKRHCISFLPRREIVRLGCSRIETVDRPSRAANYNEMCTAVFYLFSIPEIKSLSSSCFPEKRERFVINPASAFRLRRCTRQSTATFVKHPRTT